MALIDVDQVTKHFRSPKRRDGRFGAIRTLFTREYTTTMAVSRICFTVDTGEILGYLGPNGAGKSTSIKVLTGVLVPTSGKVTVDGLVPWRDRERNALNIGVVFGQRSQLWWDLPLIESLNLIAALYDVPAARRSTQIKRMRELLELDSFLGTPVRQLSLGQRMRGDLAAAMLYEPKILYLDEPTVGLDVMAKDVVRQFIADLSRSGDTTVILTTHDLADVEKLCRRIILLDHGEVTYDGRIDDLIVRYAPDKHVFVQMIESVDERVEAGPFIGDRKVDGRYLFTIDRDVAVHDLIAVLTQHHGVRDIRVEEPDLESVIKQIYAGSGG